jgi:N-dimethylarginine dimethylaminohydrolase
MPVLMCPPTYYGVEYEINPWMHVEVPVDRARARQQWEALRRAYADLGVEVVLAEARQGLPDMVFTANAAVVHGDRAVLSHFRFPQRQGEEMRWRALFESWGMRVADTGGVAFEGAGDALFVGGRLYCGHGFRTDLEAVPLVARALEVEAVPLELVDPRFYHLDTCFCPIDERTVLVAPQAFSAESLRRIRSRVERVIEVPTEVAAGFACNAIRVDATVVSSTAAEAVVEPLGEAGYRVLGLPMSEFMKAGGGVRCLSLPGVPGRVSAASGSGASR